MSGRLRILRAIPFFEPARAFGGVVTQAALTSAEFAERGHAVTVLTSDLDVRAELPRGVPLERDGYRVVYARARSVAHRVPPYACPFATAELDRWLRETDVVMLNVGLTLWNRRVARRARRLRVPYVYNAEGALCPMRLRERRRLAKALFVPLVERDVLQHAAALVAVTAKEREDYVRCGAEPERVVVIPNGVRGPLGRNPFAAAFFRYEHEIPADVPIVLFLGRITALKGLDLLIDAIARSRPPVWLAVAGPDEGEQAALERRVAAAGIAGRVRFTGPLPRDRIHGALAAAAVFALTSRSEGLPNAVLEAAAVGLPCIVTPACNLPEIAQWDAGAVVPEDPAAIAAAIEALVADPESRAARGSRAQAMVRERFALGSVVEKLESVLDRVVRDGAIDA